MSELKKWTPPKEGAFYFKPAGIFFKKLRPNVKLPQRQHPSDSGLDLRSAENVSIPAYQWKTIRCGFSMELPAGVEAQIRPRSGLAAKYGVTVLNTPGTIDSGFRGEIGVILINHSSETFVVGEGDRIAQMVISLVPRISMYETTEPLSETERGEDGLGSTGRG